MTKTKKEEVERQLEGVEGEAKNILARVSSLELEMDKERRLPMEFSARSKELENDLSKLRSVADVQFAPLSKEELNKQQVVTEIEYSDIGVTIKTEDGGVFYAKTAFISPSAGVLQRV
ncbi:uncharacterized protein LOC141633855 [Silene latifolia]|uniref:uncharacterized protein LOC141633855 n=1 Tax=Silene latifolia TaxID=37657 RepID=UPI003D7764A5